MVDLYGQCAQVSVVNNSSQMLQGEAGGTGAAGMSASQQVSSHLQASCSSLTANHHLANSCLPPPQLSLPPHENNSMASSQAMDCSSNVSMMLPPSSAAAHHEPAARFLAAPAVELKNNGTTCSLKTRYGQSLSE